MFRLLVAATPAGESNLDLLTPTIGALATIVVALLAALAAYLSAKRDRRRTLYSEAVKAALGWRELLYRVRRRDKASERALIDRFHDHQEQLTFYRAWVSSDSRFMQRSFDKLVSSVKSATEAHITAAWKSDIRPVPGLATPDDAHPDLSLVEASFLADVRSHLSPWPWRKFAVAWRNRKPAKN